MWLKSGIAAVLLVALDQITKWLALERLKPIGNMKVIPGLLDLTFVENRGAAFGMLTGQRWFFVLLTAVVVAVIVRAYYKMPKTREYMWLRFSLVFVLAGAVGNMIDRLFRGYVVDFLEVTFISFPVFNIADIYVVAGTIVTAFIVMFVIKDEPKENKD